MEIGVYNAVNAMSMVKSAIKHNPARQIEYYGFDFFYNYSTEQIGKKLEALGCQYHLIKGNTLTTVPKAAKSLPMMDIIFIDGGKSYREAYSDWEGSSMLMHESTGLFVHNADFSGVEKMIDEIPRDRYGIETFYPHSEGKVALIELNS